MLHILLFCIPPPFKICNDFCIYVESLPGMQKPLSSFIDKCGTITRTIRKNGDNGTLYNNGILMSLNGFDQVSSMDNDTLMTKRRFLSALWFWDFTSLLSFGELPPSHPLTLPCSRPKRWQKNKTPSKIPGYTGLNEIASWLQSGDFLGM